MSQRGGEGRGLGGDSRRSGKGLDLLQVCSHFGPFFLLTYVPEEDVRGSRREVGKQAAVRVTDHLLVYATTWQQLRA